MPPRPTTALAATLLFVAAPAAHAAEVRERYNSAGALVQRMTFEGDQLVEEVTVTYDESGRPVERRVKRGGQLSLESTRYPSADVVVLEITLDGQLQRRETSTYRDGRRVELVEEIPGHPTRRVSTTYDDAGHRIAEKVTTLDGEVLGALSAEYAPPEVVTPILLSLDAGGAVNSDSQNREVSVGFALSRSPDLKATKDPLEVAVSGSYRRGFRGEELFNEQLRGHVGLDYNYLLPRTTFFLFSDLERNVPANLLLDLEVAPLGVKVDLWRGDRGRLDASFVPIWNHRAVNQPVSAAAGDTCDGQTVTEDGLCEVSSQRLRGSLRVRGGVNVGRFSVNDIVEYLPPLSGEGTDYLTALDAYSILRNTLKVDYDLSPRLGIHWELIYIRDPTLVLQASCTGDASDNTFLCAGLSVSTMGSLRVNLDVSEGHGG